MQHVLLVAMLKSWYVTGIDIYRLLGIFSIDSGKYWQVRNAQAIQNIRNET